MAYVSVPKDLSKIKSKVLFSLTQRQLICFSAGAVVGVIWCSICNALIVSRI